MKKRRNKKDIKYKYKFNTLSKNGIEQPWTGLFDTHDLACFWYYKHGVKQEANGIKLVKRKIPQL